MVCAPSASCSLPPTCSLPRHALSCLALSCLVLSCLLLACPALVNPRELNLDEDPQNRVARPAADKEELIPVLTLVALSSLGMLLFAYIELDLSC